MAATCRRSETLCLTVIERVADTDAVREHCRRRVRTVRPGSLADRLAASSETLRNREHRFYYATPPPHATAVLPLDDAVSFGVFSEWSRRGNVNDVYAVVGNRATSDHEKVESAVLVNTRRRCAFVETPVRSAALWTASASFEGTANGGSLRDGVWHSACHVIRASIGGKPLLGVWRMSVVAYTIPLALCANAAITKSDGIIVSSDSCNIFMRLPDDRFFSRRSFSFSTPLLLIYLTHVVITNLKSQT